MSTYDRNIRIQIQFCCATNVYYYILVEIMPHVLNAKPDIDLNTEKSRA